MYLEKPKRLIIWNEREYLLNFCCQQRIYRRGRESAQQITMGLPRLTLFADAEIWLILMLMLKCRERKILFHSWKVVRNKLERTGQIWFLRQSSWWVLDLGRANKFFFRSKQRTNMRWIYDQRFSRADHIHTLYTWDRGLVGFFSYLSDKRVAAASDRARLIVHFGMNNQLATFICLWTYVLASSSAELLSFL